MGEREEQVAAFGVGGRGTMRLLIACLLAAVVLPAQAQTIDICDRTAQVRDAILRALDADDCAVVDSDGVAGVGRLNLRRTRLTALQSGDFDGLTGLQYLNLDDNRLATLPAGVFDGLNSLQELMLSGNRLTTLPDGVFDRLTRLQDLSLSGNQLTTLPDGVFDRLTRLQDLDLQHSRFATLPDGVFDGLTSLQRLGLSGDQLTTLPDGVFDGLTSLQDLFLPYNRLTTLPAGVFDGLTSLQYLWWGGKQLTTLPAGMFDGLTSLWTLSLIGAQLTTLPAGVFDGLTSLQRLLLSGNQLTTLPVGVFDGLTGLQTLWLTRNQLTTLPAGVFDGLTSLQTLDLSDNHLVELTRNDALFAGFSDEVEILLDGQTPEARMMAAVPLMLSAADSTRQGFVRIVNESFESGSVRVFAVDDGGHAPDPIEIPLGALQVVHFNSNDLEDGNAKKGIERGVGSPVRGDWRLDIETDLRVRVLAYVRHGDGFLTAMHDVLPRNAAHTFNPGSNMTQASRLRLVNTGTGAADVRINGRDDQGILTEYVRLTLAEGESRTLSAFDLENGANGLTGALGDGAGKWRLFVVAGRSVVGMSLLESTNGGQLTNISTAGVVANE